MKQLTRFVRGPAGRCGDGLTGTTSGVRAPERFRLRYGPWAVVTGASSGIGRQMAVRLAQARLNLVLVARRRDLLEDIAAGLGREFGIHTRVVAADLSTVEGIAVVGAGTADLDVGLLVAAAGFGTSGPFLDSDAGQERDMLNTNCWAVLSMSEHFGARFVARGGGGIVLLGSLVGRQGTPWAAHYAATKAYVLTLAEGLRLELRPRHVDVVACAPGPVHTAFADRAGMRMSTALRADDVVVPTLNALGGRGVVTPGALSKALTWSMLPPPRSRRVWIMGEIMHRMSTADA